MKPSLREALAVYAIVDLASFRNIFELSGIPYDNDAFHGGHSPLLDYVDSLLDSGVRVIQLRDKTADKEKIYELAAAISKKAQQADAYFFVNDYADIADACGADGVHVGLDDMAVAEVKKAFPNLLIGASARTLASATKAEQDGADYLGCGPIWDASPSKPDAPQPIGLEQLKKVVHSVSIPVVGIGGINLSNAPSVIHTGVAGVAMIRGLMVVTLPDQMTSSLRFPP